MALSDNGFLNDKDLSFIKVSHDASQKTSFMNIARNLLALQSYEVKQKAFIAYLYSIIGGTGVISNGVSKSILAVNATHAIGTISLQESAGIMYKLKRIDAILFEITTDIVDWNVSDICVCVKDMNGNIVYPHTVTINNKISIYFNDGAVINYKVLLY